MHVTMKLRQLLGAATLAVCVFGLPKGLDTPIAPTVGGRPMPMRRRAWQSRWLWMSLGIRTWRRLPMTKRFTRCSCTMSP